jgi:hypothetical protein
MVTFIGCGSLETAFFGSSHDGNYITISVMMVVFEYGWNAAADLD